jgi:hypothetical protein
MLFALNESDNMKLRKPSPTKIKDKAGKVKKVSESKYHLISVEDTVITRLGWEKDDDLSAVPTIDPVDGNKILVIRNNSKMDFNFEFMTLRGK